MSHFIRDTRILVLVGVFAIVCPAEGTTTLISCPPTGGGMDPISHAFYIPNYPGVSLRDLTMKISSDIAGRYLVTLTAHRDTFDGPVLESATSGIVLNGDAASPVGVTFSFGGLSGLQVSKGHTLAFVVNQQGSDAGVNYGGGDFGSLFFGTGPAGGCAAVETNDSKPPLSSVRGSVPVTVTGDASLVSLIPNSTFDSGVSGWTLSPMSNAPGTIAFSSNDADGLPASGSALVTNTGGGSGSVVFQACAQNVQAGLYSWGGKIRSSTPLSSGYAELFFGTSSTTDCSTFDQGSAGYALPDGAWHENSAASPAFGSARSISLSLLVHSEAGTGPAEANFDDIVLRPSQLATLTVLGAARVHGKNGAYFHTDLWVFNRSYTATILVKKIFRCPEGTLCNGASDRTLLAPREQRLYPDVVPYDNSFGTIELVWDSSFGSISASARTYSPAAGAPTNGTGIPALASTEARARGVFIGLGSNGGNLSSGFRSNVGVYNPSSTTANATFTLFDDSGLLLGSVSHAIPGFKTFQFNDIFAAVGAGGTVAKKSTLVMASDVPIFSFVTVIDNQTNDSSFLLPTDDELQP